MSSQRIGAAGAPRDRSVGAPGAGLRRAAAAGAIALALLAVLHYRRDDRLRRDAEQFMHRFGLDARRPLDAQSMLLEPSGDLACDVAADAALRDAGKNPPSAGAGSSEQLNAAQELMLDAIARRPGSVQHLLLLGQIAHARGKLAGGPAPPFSRVRSGRPDLWAKPLRVAAAAAPGADAVWEALGSSSLASWSGLTEEQRSEVPAVLERAFANPDFVLREFSRAVAVLGSSQTVRLLPEIAKPLRVALLAVLRGGDVRTAGLLLPRADKAERKQRSEELRKIEERRRLGDLDGMRAGCLMWMSEHRIEDFGDPRGRAQVARLLDLWPDDRIGDWSTDPRADLIGFFLDHSVGEGGEVRPEAIARAVAALTGVPTPVRARAKLLTGEITAAEDLAGADVTGSAGWSSFFVSLARFHRSRGSYLEARLALERLAPEAREECDAALERREIARAMKDKDELDAVRRSIVLRAPSDLQPWWSNGTALSLCLDPEQAAGGWLDIELVADAPAFAAFGWDGGRLGSLVVEKTGAVSIPLSGLVGRRIFWVRTLAGGPVRPSATRLRARR